ncbi:hemolysin III family protein [Clostridium sp. AL.422]|uniref:PAQR family membrane homeostasis protein TrhA n=1 Tax=Clostridium TaxID=1485 RepID=UPI00293DF1F6|nr:MULTISPECIES: hemolysin III family protein [unclassified Clostridium]MDV4151463.1 hemolysin III family protein [Clostridium sp. AL.422]
MIGRCFGIKKEEVVYNFYTKGEEIANAVTHGVGAILSIVGSIFLVVESLKTSNNYAITGVWIYCISLITLYLGSTLYHSIPGRLIKKILRILDHSSIYLLITGTYTPIILILMNSDKKSLYILIALWIIAILGILFKVFWVDRFGALSTILYILMGWTIVINIKAVLILVPSNILMLIVLGGIVYTVGCIFYAMDKMPYNHFIWHLFVMSGSALHYVAIYLGILYIS